LEEKFVRVPHIWFDLEDNDTFIAKMGEKRFLLWFYLNKLNAEMNMSSLVPIQIKKIVKEFDQLTGFSKADNIKKMLLELNKAKLIECTSLCEKSKPTDLLYVKVNTIKINHDINDKGFSMINTRIFDDKINLIDGKGFLIYCMLFKYHNQNNGDCLGDGYA